MKKYLILLALASLVISGCNTSTPKQSDLDNIERETCINLGIETGMSQSEAEAYCIDLEERVYD